MPDATPTDAVLSFLLRTPGRWRCRRRADGWEAYFLAGRHSATAASVGHATLAAAFTALLRAVEERAPARPEAW
jgi:hypothetical protein